LARHGYPVIFVDRPTLLKKLYENIRHKDKILLQKRLIRLEQGASGVRVITQDECSYDGDIVVGADGMNSAVRKHMHRLASISSPGYFATDEYSSEWNYCLFSERRTEIQLTFDFPGVPCAYKCIWGISHPVKGVEPGSIHVIMGKNQSYSVFTGPGKLHWLLYVRNPQMMYGKGVPRYTVEDEQRLAEQHFGDRINEYTTFGDIYKSKIVSGLTPLHEYQWKTWHYERIMTIGDACHKVSNITRGLVTVKTQFVSQLHTRFIHLGAVVEEQPSKTELLC
jgi:2-polyprenyl-6-methoxyphenol hydroxylase-like FAD-dependent oxidoreductase